MTNHKIPICISYKYQINTCQRIYVTEVTGNVLQQVQRRTKGLQICME